LSFIGSASLILTKCQRAAKVVRAGAKSLKSPKALVVCNTNVKDNTLKDCIAREQVHFYSAYL